MISNSQIIETRAFDLIIQSKWDETVEYIRDTYEGRKEIQIYGVDLIYSAIKYRAPSSLIILIFDLLERTYSHEIQLNRTLLLQALYISPKEDSSLSPNLCSRKWNGSELNNVADFLSNKMRMQISK